MNFCITYSHVCRQFHCLLLCLSLASLCLLWQFQKGLKESQNNLELYKYLMWTWSALFVEGACLFLWAVQLQTRQGALTKFHSLALVSEVGSLIHHNCLFKSSAHLDQTQMTYERNCSSYTVIKLCNPRKQRRYHHTAAAVQNVHNNL
jgi:hypothetical protein